MKTRIALFCGLVVAASAGNAQNYLERVGLVTFPDRKSNKSNVVAENLRPPEYRAVSGVVNDIRRAANWFDFEGRILGPYREGEELTIQGSLIGRAGSEGFQFYLARNIPKPAYEGQPLKCRLKLLAELKLAVVYGQGQTVPVVDCGVPCAPPARVLSAADLEAERIALAKDAEKLLKWHQEQAAKGMPSAQCSLGKRYLAGDGVPKDLTLARQWLEKAAAQGDPEAKAALAKLPPDPKSR